MQIIEARGKELSKAVGSDLASNPLTAAYHKVPREELIRWVYDVYWNLSEWLGREAEEMIETRYNELGEKRCEQGIPLSQLVYALILTKHHLQDYISTAVLAGSAPEAHQRLELDRLVNRFFDRVVCYAVIGYEREAASRWSPPVGARG
jgi:hypothetical protein